MFRKINQAMMLLIMGMFPVYVAAQVTPSNPLSFHIPSVTIASCDITATTATIRLKVYIPSDAYLRRFIREPLSNAVVEIELKDSIRRTVTIPNPPLYRRLSSLYSVFQRECYALLDSTKLFYAPPLDTILPFQVIFIDLEPNTTYHCFTQTRFVTYWPGAIDEQVFRSNSSLPVVFKTLPLKTSTTPLLILPRLIFTEGATLGWQTLTGGQSESYQIDVAQDSLFTKMIQGYHNRTVNSTSLRIYGLAPNTRYYYRVRAIQNGQSGSYSPIAPIQTLSIKRFNANQESLAGLVKSLPRMPNLVYDIRIRLMNPDLIGPTYSEQGVCQTNSSYYSYSTGASLSWQKTDSLLSALMDAGLPLDSAWAQDNSTCDGKNTGTSELLVKLKMNDERIRSYGFSKRYNDWASTCECRNYRLYYNFGMPVSVQEAPERLQNGLRCSPNPVSNEVQCKYSLQRSSEVQLRMLDILGRVVYEQHLGYKVSGEYEERIETGTLPEGIYMLQLHTGNEIQVTKVIIVR